MKQVELTSPYVLSNDEIIVDTEFVPVHDRWDQTQGFDANGKRHGLGPTPGVVLGLGVKRWQLRNCRISGPDAKLASDDWFPVHGTPKTGWQWTSGLFLDRATDFEVHGLTVTNVPGAGFSGGAIERGKVQHSCAFGNFFGFETRQSSHGRSRDMLFEDILAGDTWRESTEETMPWSTRFPGRRLGNNAFAFHNLSRSVLRRVKTQGEVKGSKIVNPDGLYLDACEWPELHIQGTSAWQGADPSKLEVEECSTTFVGCRVNVAEQAWRDDARMPALYLQRNAGRVTLKDCEFIAAPDSVAPAIHCNPDCQAEVTISRSVGFGFAKRYQIDTPRPGLRPGKISGRLRNVRTRRTRAA